MIKKIACAALLLTAAFGAPANAAQFKLGILASTAAPAW